MANFDDFLFVRSCENVSKAYLSRSMSQSRDQLRPIIIFFFFGAKFRVVLIVILKGYVTCNTI